MTSNALLGPWVRRFLLEHLVGERNLSRNTQKSYRDALCLLIPFVVSKTGRAVELITVEDVSANVVRLFLTDLEQSRKCGGATRNQRLATIHALARFIGEHSPEHIVWCGQIRAIPFKKTAKNLVSYLEKPEMDALLAAPDSKTSQGHRDHALLLFLYNSGARASEAAQLTIADLDLPPAQQGQAAVRIVGKGNKIRRCPLWPQTAAEVAELTAGRSPGERVFQNRCRQPLTRFGIHGLVERYAQQAAAQVPSLSTKRVSPHSIRHSTATHLLRAGVDLNTIRAWLGHASLETTQIYAEIDLERKEQALAHCEVTKSAPTKKWREDASLLAFLRAL
jgi:integrase/recombinase XerD